VLAPRPAARSALTFFELLSGPANAALSRLGLLRVQHPADELVARQGCDVSPGREGVRVAEKGLSQVVGELVHHATGYALAAHGATQCTAQHVVALGPG
jgi:hypothetical protein